MLEIPSVRLAFAVALADVAGVTSRLRQHLTSTYSSTFSLILISAHLYTPLIGLHPTKTEIEVCHIGHQYCCG